MLTPEELLSIIDTMYPLLDELNAWITTDLIGRFMARMGRGEDDALTGTDQWQLEVCQSAGGHLEELQRQLQTFTKKSEKEVREIFEDVGVRSWSSDDAFYTARNILPILAEKGQNVERTANGRTVSLSENMVKILTDAYQRTNATVKNFTRTTATASQQRLINTLDMTHLKVITGAQSYTSAVREAVNGLAEHQTRVRYPTGHTDTIETAVLRAVRTGTAQASGNLSLQGMTDRGWDLIRVSAHLGARYGDGGQNPGNHFWWQGKLYSLTGKTQGYPLFKETTGYGTGEGLCGWNCRHSFGPGDPDFNPFEDYDAEENKRAYDLSQKQRRMESAIRRSKVKALGLQTAIDAVEDPTLKAELEQDHSKAALRLQKQNRAYNGFCKENGLKRLSDRISVAKWSRSQAARATAAAKKAENQQNSLTDGQKRDTLIVKGRTDSTVVQAVQNGEVSLSVNPEKQARHLKDSEGYLPGRSYFNGTVENAQELVDQYAGTGEAKFTSKGAWSKKEVVTADRVVGVNVNPRTGEELQTKRFVIHYSKTGTHIVPTKEEIKP